jgi:hypothetical protein
MCKKLEEIVHLYSRICVQRGFYPRIILKNPELPGSSINFYASLFETKLPNFYNFLKKSIVPGNASFLYW